jgi:hypothetical protein
MNIIKYTIRIDGVQPVMKSDGGFRHWQRGADATASHSPVVSNAGRWR